MRLIAAALVPLVLAGCTGGGETVVSGFGNSGNHFGEDDVPTRLVRLLARHDGTPEITDEELARVFSVVRQKALDGDLESALVVYRLAERQRRDREEEEASGG